MPTPLHSLRLQTREMGKGPPARAPQCPWEFLPKASRTLHEPALGGDVCSKGEVGEGPPARPGQARARRSCPGTGLVHSAGCIFDPGGRSWKNQTGSRKQRGRHRRRT